MIIHERKDLLGILVGEAQSLANGFGHAHADFHVIVETNTVPRLPRGLECRWLADVVEQNAPGQCWRCVCRQPSQHHARMNPHVSFRMKLRRLLDAFHRADFRKNLLEQPGFIQQFERPPGCTFGKHSCKFVAKALGRNLRYFGGVAANGAKSFGFDFESEARGESHRAHHAEFVFLETAIRLADGANDFRFEVGLSPDVVQHFAAVVAH